MTSTQKKKILQKIVKCEAEIDELKAIRTKLCTDGYASASMSSGSGSRSYTKLDVAKVTSTINQLTQELKSLRALLSDSTNMLASQIVTVYI